MREELSISESNFAAFTEGIKQKDPVVVSVWEGLSTEPKQTGKDVESVYKPITSERKSPTLPTSVQKLISDFF